MFTKTGSNKNFTNKGKKKIFIKTAIDQEQEREARKMAQMEKAIMPEIVTEHLFEPKEKVLTPKEPNLSKSIKQATNEIIRLFSGHDNIVLSIQKSDKFLSIQIN